MAYIILKYFESIRDKEVLFKERNNFTESMNRTTFSSYKGTRTIELVTDGHIWVECCEPGLGLNFEVSTH